MKKILIKSLVFSLPVLFMYLFTLFYYATDKGDLIRVGYVLDKGNYRSIFKKELEQKEIYTNVSEINLDKPKKFTVLIIGDSFSAQKGFGYRNYLAQDETISVLYLDRFLSINPIETAYGIVNGDMLDKIKVDYIIVQSVERRITKRVDKINSNRILNVDSLKIKIEKHKNKLKKGIKKEDFPTQRMVKFPIHNFLYLFDDNAYNSDTYQVDTKEPLFTANKNKLLFSSFDLDAVKANNNLKSQTKLNATFNDLSNRYSKKGITLIVLPSPDKLDFYYDNIIDNQKYPRPLFFERFEKFPKEYYYLNSKKILQTKLKNKKDIFFYDDSHWSPWASQIIAIELKRIIVK